MTSKLLDKGNLRDTRYQASVTEYQNCPRESTSSDEQCGTCLFDSFVWDNALEQRAAECPVPARMRQTLIASIANEGARKQTNMVQTVANCQSFGEIPPWRIIIQRKSESTWKVLNGSKWCQKSANKRAYSNRRQEQGGSLWQAPLWQTVKKK